MADPGPAVGLTPACADIVAHVWRLDVTAGDDVDAGQTVAVLESMKMEIPVLAPCRGTVAEVLVSVGQIVQEGDPIVTVAG